MKRKVKIVIKRWIEGGLAIFLILLLSQPTYIIYFDHSPEEYIKWIERLSSFYSNYPSLDDYYSSLEKDSSFYRLVLNQLKDKEKNYFLQMRPFISKIAKASQKTGVPTHSIASHIKRESQFDPWAVSNKGAYGLMGITIWAYQDIYRLRSRTKWVAEALEEYGDFSWEEVQFDPELNIVVGTAYYKFLLNQFKDTTLASLAYNWGMGNVYLMQERYGDKEGIFARLEDLASTRSEWVEPFEYPEHISNFKAVFQKVEERIKFAYATYKEIHLDSFASLESPEKNPSS
ncbi:transglycosylase SLT domain-containing protein [Candidatus Aerophobetes bacterium]|nr:transglycosylase SLT domain-containing protein [Candidatus Aerophobetes bacterium]